MKNQVDRNVDPEMGHARLECANLAVVAGQNPAICGLLSPQRRASAAPVLKRRQSLAGVASDVLAPGNPGEHPLGAAFLPGPAPAKLSRCRVGDPVYRRVVASAASAAESDSLD